MDNNSIHIDSSTEQSFLINKVYEELKSAKNLFHVFQLGDEQEVNRIGFNNNSTSGLYIVPLEDTAIELGSPQVASSSIILRGSDQASSMGNLWVLGNEIAHLKESPLPFLQIVIFHIDKNVTPPSDFNLRKLRNLTNKLPGFMSCSMSGKSWIRIDKTLANKDFSLYSLGQCIWKNYSCNITGLNGIDIIIAAGNSDIVERFRPIIDASQVLSRESRKSRWLRDGVISCDDLSCNVCDDKPSCDTLRRIVTKRTEARRDGSFVSSSPAD